MPMEEKQALDAFAAFSQEPRLKFMWLLVVTGPDCS